jgi:hypothetical protein
MNNPITKIIQKVACKVPMIQSQEHLRTISNLKPDETLGYVSELEDLLPTPRTWSWNRNHPKTPTLQQLASVHATHKEPAFENKFHMWLMHHIDLVLFHCFKAKNHGISEAAIDNMLRVSREFFHLPESERLQSYSDDPMKTTRLSTSFNVRTEQVSSWRDYLRLHCHPLEKYMQEWPTNPPSFRYEKYYMTY